MKKHCFRVPVLIFLVSAFMAAVWCQAAFCNQPDSQAPEISSEYFVYYFYTSQRCTTCKRIEQWSKAAVTQHFKDQTASGQVQWQALNIEQPENEHFIKDFQLYTKSVIVAEYKEGRLVRWVNLPDIWTLSRDREKFIDYVARETGKFMENH